jgi:hypothetical protein
MQGSIAYEKIPLLIDTFLLMVVQNKVNVINHVGTCQPKGNVPTLQAIC